MNSYEFSIVATGLSIDGDEWEDAFYAAGCDDALVSIQRGVFLIEFEREAESAAAAVESACADVRRAGATVKRIEPDPLVSSSDIAERAGITRQAVSLYVRGERGEGFPAPIACVTSSRPLWCWREVAEWLHADGRLPDEALDLAKAIDLANGELDRTSPEPARVLDGNVLIDVLFEREDTILADASATMADWLKPPAELPRLRTVSAGVLAAREGGFKLRQSAAAPRPRAVLH
jgi:hypothetical protein